MALTVIPLSGLASDVVDSISAGAGGGGPRIANVQIANSSWGLLDDTAVGTDGGYVLINGSGFASGCSVLVANTQATTVTFANSSLLRVEVPARSASTYAVYVLNPDGGTAIGINALTYSAFPAWATGSTLSSGAVDVEISVQLSASDATTYTLQAGSSLPANTTLASNGLFSGTITGVNEETTYTFTVEATDAQNQNTPRTFSITITVGDGNFKSTTLLLNADANTFVRDASNNAFNITVNGDTRLSAFSPYNTNWSNFFDGTGDYLSIAANSAFNIGASESFTVECWVYSTYTANIQTIFNICDTGSSGYGSARVQIKANQGFQFLAGPGGGWGVNIEQGTYTPGTWTHVAFVRNVSTFLCFVNGQQVGTATYSNALVQDRNTFIGFNSGTAYPVNGYISNFRFVKGTALYTATFTPPTTALTAVSNTQLLICQSNRIIDNSTNAFTITRNGDVKVTSFGPFTETDVTTGSGYFDGSGDYLSTPNAAALRLGAGDFTVEAWIYPNRLNNTYGQSICGTYGYVSLQDRGWGLVLTDTGYLRIFMFGSAGAGFTLTSSTVTNLNAWNHVAAVRNGTTVSLFLNGVQVASGTSSKDEDYTVVDFNVATVRGDNISPATGHPGQSLQGNISNLRLVKGTAVYTSAFTPPTAPLTVVANTQLLTLQNRIGHNNHQFVDESGINHLFTRGGNASQGSFSPYVPTGWSGYFDGVGDYLTIPGNAAFQFPGDLTIEAWIIWDGTYSENGRIIYGTGGPGSLDQWGMFSPGGLIYFAGISSSTSPPINRWVHLAVTRSGSTIRHFIDGVASGSGTVSSTIGSTTNTLYIGFRGDGYHPWYGYISNFRIIKGTALYTSNFTPSTTPLTSVANTSLLTLRGNWFTDDGPNRFAITRTGDVKIEPFSPFKSHTITANTHSVYFDGSGDYLSVPNNSAFAYGTGDFTIEFWFYMSAVAGSGNYYVLFDGRPSTTSGAYVNITINNATPESYVNGALVISGSALSAGIWYHFAYARSGSSTKMFINGTQVGSTYTDTTNYINGADRPVIGTNGFNVAQYNFNGYISNVRIVKGTAVYTSAFTPSTTPLTAISNTVLLTCQSTTIIDNSTNAFTITATGNATASKFNPFGETIAQGVEYRANTHGGSVYFDGTSDSLITTTTVPAIGTGDFTIDAWVYLLSAPSVNGWIYGNRSGSATSGYLFISNSLVPVYGADTGSIDLTSSTAVRLATWNHIAVSRSGSTIRMFLNGILVASATNTNNYSYAGTQPVGYASSGSAYTLNGYISDLRVVLGTALYKSSFIPPSTTLSAVSGTVFLLNNDRGGIMDVSGRNVLECVGNVRVSTDTKKYGTGSMYFDGTGDYLLPPPSQNFAFRTGDFTIELWIKTSSTADDGILQISTTAGGFATSYTNGLMMSIVSGTVYWALNGSSVNTSTSFNDGNWHHLAMTRSGSTVRVFKNGTQISTATNAGDVTGTNLVIGGYYSSTYTLDGYIDDLRITKGVARYTSNFTAPTAAHQTK
jgi:hypothetical protein